MTPWKPWPFRVDAQVLQQFAANGRNVGQGQAVVYRQHGLLAFQLSDSSCKCHWDCSFPVVLHVVAVLTENGAFRAISGCPQ
jgi:hypothetical protein